MEDASRANGSVPQLFSPALGYQLLRKGHCSSLDPVWLLFSNPGLRGRIEGSAIP